MQTAVALIRTEPVLVWRTTIPSLHREQTYQNVADAVFAAMDWHRTTGAAVTLTASADGGAWQTVAVWSKREAHAALANFYRHHPREYVAEVAYQRSAAAA